MLPLGSSAPNCLAICQAFPAQEPRGRAPLRSLPLLKASLPCPPQVLRERGNSGMEAGPREVRPVHLICLLPHPVRFQDTGAMGPENQSLPPDTSFQTFSDFCPHVARPQKSSHLRAGKSPQETQNLGEKLKPKSACAQLKANSQQKGAGGCHSASFPSFQRQLGNILGREQKKKCCLLAS